MCGLSGFIDLARHTPEADLLARAEGMAARLAHRGPDGDGVWADAGAGLALGHRRLAILDLSPTGHQPMVSADGRYVIAYNGEVYNFLELRAELEAGGVAFRGNCDTEVVVEAIAAWGLEAALRRMTGMFALALWDKAERILCLARDRLGIKPLYWGRCGDHFLFASEIKALRAHPAWKGKVDREALVAYLRFGYVPSPRSIYEGISKLEPGTFLTLREGEEPEVQRYWDLREITLSARARQQNMDDGEAADRLDGLLRDAVKGRMVADVPLGALLSGGVDSSTVTALMQAQSSRPVKTFSIGFAESAFDESSEAAAVARHLGTDHTELMISPADARAVIPDLPHIYDEPFADSSQISTYLVSRLARDKVSVALSGDGGDEMFAGYNRHRLAAGPWQRLERVPLALRRLASSSLRALPPRLWDMLFAPAPKRLRHVLTGDRMHKLATVLAGADGADLYGRLVSQWPDPESLVVEGAPEGERIWDDPGLTRDVPGLMARMRYMDTVGYLPGDILTKLDRASMAVGLEARVPLIDHRVAEFAAALPPHMLIRNGCGKWLLRQVLHRYVPEELVTRPKTGFGVPLDSWLRGPLRDWAEGLLSRPRLEEEGFFAPAPVRRAWKEHLSGRRNHQHRLWAVLMFQAWQADERLSN
jgi:asparagine synthase (glutamine-hydrolysing)